MKLSSGTFLVLLPHFQFLVLLLFRFQLPHILVILFLIHQVQI